MKPLITLFALIVILSLGCAGNSALVIRALDQSEAQQNDSNNRLMLANHFSSTLPPELNADYHAILRVPGFSQRSWTIADPKARLWCVEATQKYQTEQGKIDPKTGKGLITVEAVMTRCSPLVEARVDLEHMCVTVEEPKKHFTQCTVEAKITVQRYKAEMDNEMNFRYQPDSSFGENGEQIYRASKKKTQNVEPTDDLTLTTRTLLEAVSAETAIAVNEKIQDANALSR